jgi:hypothetical protein
MHPTLLQLDPLQSTIQLANYGPLGIMAVLFISAIVYLEKIRRSRDVETTKQLHDQQEKITRLEERVDKLQSEDRTRMLEVIQHNTDIMEEVVAILQKNKH